MPYSRAQVAAIIDQYIKQNGIGAITGIVLNGVLKDMNALSYDMDGSSFSIVPTLANLSDGTLLVNAVDGALAVVANDTGTPANNGLYILQQLPATNPSNWQKQGLSYTAENVANKATDLTSPDNTKYPTVQAIVNALTGKVDTAAGYGLSQNNYTSAEKTKLANMSEHFVGKFTTLVALQTAFPTGLDGQYAIVESTGVAAQEYVWDSVNGVWAASGGTGAVTSVNGQTGAVSLSTDNIGEGSNPARIYFTAARVLATALTGIVFTDSSLVVATDLVLAGIGKLQAQITALFKIPTGGSTGMALTKNSGTAGDTGWSFQRYNGAWVSGNALASGDIVSSGNSFFRAKSAISSGSNTINPNTILNVGFTAVGFVLATNGGSFANYNTAKAVFDPMDDLLFNIVIGLGTTTGDCAPVFTLPHSAGSNSYKVRFALYLDNNAGGYYNEYEFVASSTTSISAWTELLPVRQFGSAFTRTGTDSYAMHVDVILSAANNWEFRVRNQTLVSGAASTNNVNFSFRKSWSLSQPAILNYPVPSTYFTTMTTTTDPNTVIANWRGNDTSAIPVLPGTITQLGNVLKDEVGLAFIKGSSGAATGTSVFAATLSQAITSYETNAIYYITFASTNTAGTATLNINGLGAVSLIKNGVTSIPASSIVVGARYAILYSGSVFEIIGDTSSGGGGGTADKLGLTPTAVKTAAYTAVAGDMVIVDATSGIVPITLPTAPADGTVLAIKMIAVGAGFSTTVTAGGSDVFNATGGVTTFSMVIKSQGVLMQYKATGAIWYVVSDDLGLTQLDARYNGPAQTMYGAIYSKSSWVTGDLSGGILNTAGTVVTSNKLVVTNGTVHINYYTALQRWKKTVQFVPATKNSSASVVTMGILDGESAIQNILSCSFDYSTGANSGLLSMNVGSVVSSSALAFSAADTLQMSLERLQDLVIATITNVTTGASYLTINYFFPILSSNVVNTGRFTINNTSVNAITINSIDIGSQETMNPTLIIMGTSKSVGYYATDFMYSYPRKIQEAIPGTVILAGGFDKSQDYLNKVPEIIALKPKQIIIEPSVNDVIQGVSSATWQANTASVVTQLQAAGIKVFLLDGIYDTYSGGNSSGLYTWVHATYPSSMIIPSYSAGQAVTGSVNGDNIHPSQLGHDIVYQAILDSRLIAGGTYTHRISDYKRNVTITDVLNIGTNVITPSSIVFPGTTGGGSSTPTFIDLGSSFSNPGALLANLKFKLYNNGAGNLAGWTLSGSNGLEAHTYSGSWHSWFINSVLQMLVNSTELRVINGQFSVYNAATQLWTMNTAGIAFNGGGSSTTPTYLDMGTGFSSAAGTPSSCKIFVYRSSSSNVMGFGFSVANGLEYHAYTNAHTWFINAVQQMQLTAAGLSVVGLKTGSTAPTQSGLVKHVTTDANGQLSFVKTPFVLAEVRGVDAKTVASTNLYTAPTGRNVIITAVDIIVSSVGTGPVAGTLDISDTTVGTAGDICASTSTLPLALKSYGVLPPIMGAKSLDAGNIAKVNITAAATVTGAMTYDFIVRGYYNS